MWIAEFARTAGLPVGTVRHFVRLGLLKPKTGLAGGSRPYMEFTPRDLRLLGSIRAGQALGLSLAEIKVLVDERRSGGSSARMLQALTAQQQRLRQRVAELQALQRFVDAKVAWLRAGRLGAMPEPPATPGLKG